MVDVDQAGELVSARQPRPEHDVVAVAENVVHPHRPIGGCLRKLCKPCRFGLRARCELASDTGTQHVIVTRHLGDHREQRRRFRSGYVEERRDQVLAGQRRQVRVLRPGERVVAPRVGNAQQRAHVGEQAQRVPIGEGASNISEQVWLGRGVLPSPGSTPGRAAAFLCTTPVRLGHGRHLTAPYALAAYAASLSLSGTMHGKRG